MNYLDSLNVDRVNYVHLSASLSYILALSTETKSAHFNVNWNNRTILQKKEEGKFTLTCPSALES